MFCKYFWQHLVHNEFIIALFNTLKFSETPISVAVFSGILQRRTEIIVGLVVCGEESENATDFSPSTYSFPCKFHSTIASDSFIYHLRLSTEIIK